MTPSSAVTAQETAQTEASFWSIERVIAFVVAPVATVASGWIAELVATELPGHPHVSSGGIYAFMAVVAAGVAGAFIKWLDGRTKWVAHITQVEHFATGQLAPVEALIPEAERKSLIAELEGVVTGHVAKLTRVVSDSTATMQKAIAALPPAPPDPAIAAAEAAAAKVAAEDVEKLAATPWPGSKPAVADTTADAPANTGAAVQGS